MKVQFIIVGWYYEKFPEFIDQLIYLNRNFDRINIFWSCHKEPPNRIKDNFNYKLFPNIGLEDGAYQQAIDYLNLSDDTILFLMHDDMAIKSFQFIEVCIDLLNKYKVIGNGLNYCDYINLDDEIKGYEGKKYIDFVKEDCKILFKNHNSKELIKTIRLSFLCLTRKTLRELYGFEVIWDAGEPTLNDKNEYVHNGNKPYGGIGNLQQLLFSYKINKVFGSDSITYLSDKYQDSKYLFECNRGKDIKIKGTWEE